LLEAETRLACNEGMLKTTTALAAMAVAFSVQALADESYPTNQCVDRLHREVRLAAIADKVALGRSDETGALMFDLDRPADATERSALALWSKLRQACFDLGADFRRGLGRPEQAALATRLFGLHQQLLVELGAAQITYAEFNRRRVELYSVARSLEAQIVERGEQATAPTGQAGI
jgi:hypothetical protein